MLLEERFERALLRAEREGRHLALLAIELDHFLGVVERMGGGFGDRLLCAAAERLSARIRRSDTLARVRDRGFAALLEGLADAAAADALSAELRELMAPPFRLDGQDGFLSASVGIALYPTHGRAFGALMHAAELSRRPWRAVARSGSRHLTPLVRCPPPSAPPQHLRRRPETEGRKFGFGARPDCGAAPAHVMRSS